MANFTPTRQSLTRDQDRLETRKAVMASQRLSQLRDERRRNPVAIQNRTDDFASIINQNYKDLSPAQRSALQSRMNKGFEPADGRYSTRSLSEIDRDIAAQRGAITNLQQDRINNLQHAVKGNTAEDILNQRANTRLTHSKAGLIDAQAGAETTLADSRAGLLGAQAGAATMDAETSRTRAATEAALGFAEVGLKSSDLLLRRDKMNRTEDRADKTVDAGIKQAARDSDIKEMATIGDLHVQQTKNAVAAKSKALQDELDLRETENRQLKEQLDRIQKSEVHKMRKESHAKDMERESEAKSGVDSKTGRPKGKVTNFSELDDGDKQTVRLSVENSLLKKIGESTDPANFSTTLSADLLDAVPKMYADDDGVAPALEDLSQAQIRQALRMMGSGRAGEELQKLLMDSVTEEYNSLGWNTGEEMNLK